MNCGPIFNQHTLHGPLQEKKNLIKKKKKQLHVHTLQVGVSAAIITLTNKSNGQTERKKSEKIKKNPTNHKSTELKKEERRRSCFLIKRCSFGYGNFFFCKFERK